MKYFLQLRDGTDIALDPEGREFDSEAALRETMIRDARDMMSGDVAEGRVDLRLRIDAETGDGRVVHSVSFSDALEIIYPDPEPRRASA